MHRTRRRAVIFTGLTAFTLAGATATYAVPAVLYGSTDLLFAVVDGTFAPLLLLMLLLVFAGSTALQASTVPRRKANHHAHRPKSAPHPGGQQRNQIPAQTGAGPWLDSHLRQTRHPALPQQLPVCPRRQQ